MISWPFETNKKDITSAPRDHIIFLNMKKKKKKKRDVKLQNNYQIEANPADVTVSVS